MDEKNELNDIILDKNDATNNSKKIILSVATLGVVLIIVVVLMNSLSSNSTNNLPQPSAPEAILPPEPQVAMQEELADEPLFQDVEVIEEEPSFDENLDLIAKKLKEESLHKNVVVEEIEPLPAPAPVVKKPVQKHIVKEQPKPTIHKTEVRKVQETKVVQKTPQHNVKKHYIQVGSFSIYKPNDKFLKSITDNGFSYKFHEVIVKGKSIKKVLVGPFGSKKDARNALKTVRKNVIAGAFLVEI